MRKVTSLFVVLFPCIFGIFYVLCVFGMLLLLITFPIFPPTALAETFSITETGGDCGAATSSSLLGVFSQWDASARTCTLTADNVGPIVVSLSASNITFDGDGHTLTNSVVSIVGQSEDVVRNIRLVNGGVMVDSSPTTTLSAVSVSGGTYGITIADSPHVLVQNSSVTDATGYNFSAYGDIAGLMLRGNSFLENMVADGFMTYHENFLLVPTSTIDIDQSNTVDGRIIYYFEHQSDRVFDALPNAGVFYCVACQNSTLSSTTFDGTHMHSQINFFLSATSSVQDNTVEHAREYGLDLAGSWGTQVRDNTFSFNSTAVRLADSANTVISHNIFSGNASPGGSGIEVNASAGNTNIRISQNRFEGNILGIANQSPGVTVVQNDFLNNSHDIDNYTPSAVFSEPLPIGGNYFDKYQTPEQGCRDDDLNNICDLPYSLTQFTASFTDPRPWTTESGWLGTSTPTATTSPIISAVLGGSNVLFLPGLEASRLYSALSGDLTKPTKLWEPSGDALVPRLYLDPDGASLEQGIYAGDLLDTAYVPVLGNIYKSFIDDMNRLQASGMINAWKGVPYDWRFLPDEILANTIASTTESTTNSSPNIISTLEELARTSKTGKVTIVAHSNGGLVAKRLTQLLGSRASDLVDKIIFIAVPQLGAPKAVGALLHGFDQGIGQGFASIFMGGNKISPLAARTLSHNMSAAYALLPSNVYFQNIEDKNGILRFDASPAVADLRSQYGSTVQSESALENFVDDSWRKGIGDYSTNINYPSVGNAKLFSQAQDVHTNLDYWVAPVGIQTYFVAGWGEDTMSGIEYYTGGYGGVTAQPSLLYRPLFIRDGDGTVPVMSALWNSEGNSEENSEAHNHFWLDLTSYNHDHSFSKIGSVYPRLHADILEVQPLRDLIDTIIAATSSDSVGITSPLPPYISTSSPATSDMAKKDAAIKKLHIFLHPQSASNLLTMHIYDSTDNDEQHIADSRVDLFGDLQYISVPAGSQYRLVVSKDGNIMGDSFSNSFALEVMEMAGDTVLVSTTAHAIDGTAFSDATSTSIVYNISPEGMVEKRPTEMEDTASTSTNAFSTQSYGETNNPGTTEDQPLALAQFVPEPIHEKVAAVIQIPDDLLVLPHISMYTKDPIQQFERVVKEVHDTAGKYSKPVLRRYPLLFTFFLTFSVASVLHGFDLMTDQVPLFHNHPSYLFLLGVIALFLTGTLYKLLERDRK